MMFRSRPSRRRFLSQFGSAAALAPFVPLLEAHAQAGLPKRVCFFHTPNGLLRQELVPNGDAYKRILAPANAHKRDITFLEGLHMKSYYAQTPRPSNDHPPPLGHILTGSDTIDPKDGKAPSQSASWFASDVSIDQYLAGRIQAKTPLPFPSLVLGVEVGYYGWHISHSERAKAIFPDNDPVAVRNRLLAAGDRSTAPSEAVARATAERKSARDVVKAELGALMTKVSAADRRKIEAHLQVLGEVEKRDGIAGGGGSKTSCEGFVSREHADNDKFIRNGKLQMDNVAHAFACDLTRVALVQWDICATNRRFGWLGVDRGHHDLSHAGPAGDVYEGLTKIGAWYAQQFVYLIERLKAIPEGNGSVFDNTLLVWLSEHSSSSGDHGRNNLPFILAGTCGGAIAPGRMLKFDHAHNDLFVSIAHAMGFPDVTTFGRKDVCRGPLPGLAA